MPDPAQVCPPLAQPQTPAGSGLSLAPTPAATPPAPPTAWPRPRPGPAPCPSHRSRRDSVYLGFALVPPTPPPPVPPLEAPFIPPHSTHAGTSPLVVVAVAPSPPSVSPLPPCLEGSFSGTRLPTSRPILPSAASVSMTIWETRKWPPLHPTLTSGYARTQRCLPLFLPSVLLTAQPPARRPPPPRTGSCTCLSSCGPCPAAAERCWLAATLRPALRRPLDPLSPSVPRVVGPAPG